MYANMMDTIGFVSQFDPEVGQAMNEELGRQRRNLELIASENLVSPAVMAAMGSALTNKYAEGLPHKRYYGGCEYVDVVEEIAIERACKLFGAVCQCTAPFRCTGKHCCILRTAPAGRYGYGYEPGTRRPPDTRFSGQHLRQVLQLRSL